MPAGGSPPGMIPLLIEISLKKSESSMKSGLRCRKGNGNKKPGSSGAKKSFYRIAMLYTNEEISKKQITALYARP